MAVARSSRTDAARPRTGAEIREAFLAFFEARGHKRMPWQTPLEFSRRVVTCEGPRWAAVHAITMIFCDVRYGNPPQDAERDAQAMLKALRVRSRGNGKTK